MLQPTLDFWDKNFWMKRESVFCKKLSFSASSWLKASLGDGSFKIFDLAADFLGLAFVMFSVFEQVSEFLFLRKNFGEVWIQVSGIVRQHLEITLDLHHFHVLQESDELHFPITRLAVDPSQVVNDEFRGILNENVGPEVFDKRVREKEDASPCAIFSKSLHELFPLGSV